MLSLRMHSPGTPSRASPPSITTTFTTGVFTGAFSSLASGLLEHDPENWKPVFGQDHAQSEGSRPWSDSTELDQGLATGRGRASGDDPGDRFRFSCLTCRKPAPGSKHT